MSDLCYFCNKPLGGTYVYYWSNACHAHCKPIGVSVSERQRLDELAALLNRPYGNLTGGERKQVADEITALRARLESVEKERDEARDNSVADFMKLLDARRRAERAEAALATARRDAYERAAKVAETAKAVCARCNSPEDNHPYRHPFVPVVMVNIPAAIRALANEAET